MMRLGISPFATTREATLEMSRLAVAGGLDTLWLGDGYLTNPDFPGWAGGMESMVELSWLAGSLPEARVGITAAVLPLRDPAWLVKQANTLHRISGGGFVLVVAPGFWAHDLQARGIDFASRAAVFEERLDELLRLLIDESLSPGPPAGGAPPIWLAGAAATMRRALERGLPFQSSRATPEELEPLAQRYFEAGGSTLAHRIRLEFGSHEVEGAAVEWHAVRGSADQLVDALGLYAELGVSDLSIVPGQDDATSLRTVEVLANEVVPQL
jgi:alkanesulfonate monooxygenase SsuD/methylene tetrahydromethanopterin reductase-like flavin-dependent oxidoreductase (luciferase family)